MNNYFKPLKYTAVIIAGMILPIYICFSYFFEKNYFSWAYYCFVSIFFGIILLFKTIPGKIKTINVNSIDLLLILYSSYIIIYYFFVPNYAIISKHQIIFFTLPFYFLFGSGKMRNFDLLAKIISIVCLFEILIALLQLLGMIKNINDYFQIAGTLGNPNVFAELLALGVPMLLFLFKHESKKSNQLLILTVLLLSISFIFFVKARGAILGLLLFFTVISFRFLSRKKRIISILIFTLLTCLLFLIKHDSMTGRLLIWKVSLNAITTKPFLGFGINSFSQNYLRFQSAFLNTSTNEQFKWIAGEPEWAYNELIEHAFEGGIPLALLWLGLLTAAFWPIIRNWRKTNNISDIQLALLGIFVVFTTISLVNFTFSVYPILLIFLIALSFVSHDLKPVWIINKKYLYLFLSIWLLVATIQFIGICDYLPNSFKIRKIQNTRVIDNDSDDYLRKLADQYPLYGRLQMLCGAKAYQRGEHTEAMKYLDRSIQTTQKSQAKLLKAKILIDIQQYNKAEVLCKEVRNQLPNRITPLYFLFLIAKAQDDITCAIDLAHDIEHFQVKIKNRKTEKIKTEAKIFLYATKNDNN
jgi:O-antigen ligase